MLAAIISLVLLIALILIAIRMISLKRLPDEASNGDAIGPLIHASGIYSIVRKSPREDLFKIRPPEQEIRKYLSSINEDIKGQALSPYEKMKLLEKWQQSMEENIRVIEQGDAEEIEFYYFDTGGDQKCPVCAGSIERGRFVSREEIFKNPIIIPPFHLGCTTRLIPYRGKENLRETTIIGNIPLFSDDATPPLPEWKRIIKLT